jgi:hypothetical protein
VAMHPGHGKTKDVVCEYCTLVNMVLVLGGFITAREFLDLVSCEGRP